jgi:hypothetical protein
VRAAYPAGLEVADGTDADACAMGQLFLGPPGQLPMPAKELARVGSGGEGEGSVAVTCHLPSR